MIITSTKRKREIIHTSDYGANIGEEVQELHMLLLKNHLQQSKVKMLKTRMTK